MIPSERNRLLKTRNHLFDPGVFKILRKLLGDPLPDPEGQGPSRICGWYIEVQGQKIHLAYGVVPPGNPRVVETTYLDKEIRPEGAVDETGGYYRMTLPVLQEWSKTKGFVSRPPW
jgi:hypothetical protein